MCKVESDNGARCTRPCSRRRYHGLTNKNRKAAKTSELLGGVNQESEMIINRRRTTSPRFIKRHPGGSHRGGSDLDASGLSGSTVEGRQDAALAAERPSTARTWRTRSRSTTRSCGRS